MIEWDRDNIGWDATYLSYTVYVDSTLPPHWYWLLETVVNDM